MDTWSRFALCSRMQVGYTLELKTRIERSLGRQKAEEYFDLLKRFLSLKISKSNFDKLCINKIGRENALCSDIPQSPRKGRTLSIHDRKFSDHLSPLGPYGKNHSTKRMRKVLCSGSMTATFTRTCQNGGDILDTSSLRKKLEQKWETEGVKISMDCDNLLNNGLDVYLKRLIKPCLDLAGSRSIHKHIDQRCSCDIPGLMGMLPERYVQKKSEPIFAKMLDFRVTMELNPLIIGADWPIELEKVCLCASED
ncbi:hypothetical protein I3843_02G001200 [Carya illinoinensis]|nr:hypothetical protein I3843_02G001200 [Carya illinoinensis]